MGSSASISRATCAGMTGLGGERVPFAKQIALVYSPVGPVFALSSELTLCSPRAPAVNSAGVEIPLDLVRGVRSGPTTLKDGSNATVESRPAGSCPSAGNVLERAASLGSAGPEVLVGCTSDRTDKPGNTVYALPLIPDPLSSERVSRLNSRVASWSWKVPDVTLGGGYCSQSTSSAVKGVNNAELFRGQNNIPNISSHKHPSR